jgi:hypothetical protein
VAHFCCNFQIPRLSFVKSKVFVSCGQHSTAERKVANDVCDLLNQLGFETYLAINVQTITEINARIIRELKDSDAYLFINFRRERIKKGVYRGSLFSNQELAIAYAFDFERLLIVNQKGVTSEGMLRYIGNNTETFSKGSDCCAVVRRALTRARWTTDYSRRLRAGKLRWGGPLNYGGLTGQFLYLDIINGRPDIAALEATARLYVFGKVGDQLQPSTIRSPLKATGRPGFSHTIFPKSHEAFDLLCIGSTRSVSPTVISSTSTSTGTVLLPQSSAPKPQQVFLNGALDVYPISPLPITPGVWTMEYEVFAIGFPVLVVQIELDFPSTGDPSARVLGQNTR